MAGLKKFMYLHPTELRMHEQAADDELALGALTMSGDIAMAGNEVTGLPTTPTSDSAATSKAYVDNQITGLNWKPPCLTLRMVDDAAGGPPTLGSGDAGDAYVVDSVTGAWSGFSLGDIVGWNGTAWSLILAGSGGNPADGARVVVDAAPGSGGSFNGHALDIAIYVSGTGWTFEDPSDGWAVLINGETDYYENTAWVYDTSTPEWVQFSGAGQIIAGVGLLKTGNTLDVRLGNGITENPTDYVGIDLATNSGLELVGTSPDQELQAKVDGAHGIIIGASGLELEIDDTPDTLDVDGDGLKVVGLPSLFKINDVAVGSTVTAANLDTLTDTSNADALHTHNITSVEEAQRVEHTHLNNTSVTTGRAVRWSGTNNEVTHADNGTAANSNAIGVARTGGAANPGTSEVVKHGVCASVISSATVNTAYYLGTAGALVLQASIPKPGYIVRMGFAVNGTDLDVQIQDYGRQLA